MNSIYRNRVLLLFVAAIGVLLLALFWPESKKPGEIQKYYSLPSDQLMVLEYRGEMVLSDKNKVRVHYVLSREENPLNVKEAAYKIEIRELKAVDEKVAKRVAEISQLRTFYASALVRTIIQDWSAPDFYYIIPHETQRDAEYGLKDCRDQLTLQFRSKARKFCLGTATQGDTRRYLLDVENDKLLLTPDFTVRRIVNNIFAQREQSLHPFGADGADLIEAMIGADELARLPLLREKTGGSIKLRMLVKDEGKKKINVWHVENTLSIMPSHAAEFAQLLYALRVSAPFAMSAGKPDAAIAELAQQAGIDATLKPSLSGAIKLKKTDKQDVQLTNFAFYPPGVKARETHAFQFDQQLVRPKDTLVVTNYNAGYITADLYPRLLTILQKFENDLLEAQKKGEQEKASKAAKEKAPPIPR